MTTTTMSSRAEVYHCPFCGEEDIRPHSASTGEWECRSCLRAFTVTLLGMIRPPASPPDGLPEPVEGSEEPS
jgi:transposase-like protein